MRTRETEAFVRAALVLLLLSLASCSPSHEDKSSQERTVSQLDAAVSVEVKSSSAKNLQSSSLEPSPVVVTTLTALTAPSMTSNVGRRSFTAITRGINQASMDVKRPGRIIAVEVALGESVETGKVLMRLDSVLERLAVDAAKAKGESADAGKEQAERNLQRATALFAESGISESRLEDVRLAYRMAKANYDGAVAELGIAQKHLAETRIVAPFDGEITNLPSHIGETPSPGGIVAEVTDRRQLIVDIFLSEAEVKLLTVGMKVEVSSFGDSTSPLTGELRALSPKGNDVTKLFKAEIIIDNVNLTLHPGVTCRVMFPSSSWNHPIVPFSAIIDPSGKDRSYRVAVLELEPPNDTATVYDKAQRVSLRVVALGERVGSGVVILSGLEFGERIIVKGAQSLSNNQHVRALREVSLDSLLH